MMLSNNSISQREMLCVAMAAIMGIVVLPCLNSFVPPASFWHESNFRINVYGKYI